MSEERTTRDSYHPDYWLNMRWLQPMPPDPEPPSIGSTRQFIPDALTAQNGGSMIASYGQDLEQIRVTGVCVYVNRRTRYARYEYPLPCGGKAHECFKY